MFNKTVATPNTVVSQHRDTLLAHAAIAGNLAKKLANINELLVVSFRQAHYLIKGEGKRLITRWPGQIQ